MCATCFRVDPWGHAPVHGFHLDTSRAHRALLHALIWDQAERRCTISFLISAIALAGLSPFGQVRAQFMIVWHR